MCVSVRHHAKLIFQARNLSDLSNSVCKIWQYICIICIVFAMRTVSNYYHYISWLLFGVIPLNPDTDLRFPHRSSIIVVLPAIIFWSAGFRLAYTFCYCVQLIRELTGGPVLDFGLMSTDARIL